MGPETVVTRVSRRVRSARRDHVRAALLAGVASLGYLVVAAAHGALGASRNDDWAYYRSAFQLARDGHFQPDPYTLPMLVGQVVMARPVVAVFGPSMAALQVLVCLLGGVALFCSYAVIRSFVPHGWALFCVACLALGPVYGGISVTFMTDVPSFAFQTLCLLAGLRAVGRPLGPGRLSAGWLAASLVLGLVAFSIRDYGAAAPTAVLALCLLCTWPAGAPARRRLAALAVGYLVVLATLYLWRRGLVDSPGSPTLVRPDLYTLTRILRLCFTAALLVSPATLLLVPRRLAPLLARGVALPAVVTVGVLGTAGAVWHLEHLLLTLNYLTPWGSYPESLGHGGAVLPHPVWLGLQALSVASALLLCLAALETLRRPARALLPQPESAGHVAARLAALYVALSFGLVAAVHALTSGPLFDRYLLTVVPFLTALLVHVAGAPSWTSALRWGAAASLTLAGVVGLAVVDASATFDGAKWRLSRTVVAHGYDAGTIDGGLEWFGFHQAGAIQVPHPTPPDGRSYRSLFAEPDVCVTVSLPDADGHYLGEAADSRVASLTTHTLFGLAYPMQAHRTPATCRSRP